MVDNTVLTVKEVAALLRVDEKTVYRLVKKRELPGFKVSGAWRFKRADIESWLSNRRRPSHEHTDASTRKQREGDRLDGQGSQYPYVALAG